MAGCHSLVNVWETLEREVRNLKKKKKIHKNATVNDETVVHIVDGIAKYLISQHTTGILVSPREGLV